MAFSKLLHHLYHEKIPSLNIIESSNQNYFRLCLIWYIIFGLFHEIIHIVCAIIYLDGSVTANSIVKYDGVMPFICRLFFERYTIIPYTSYDEKYDDTTIDSLLSVIRHAGWIGSVLIATIVMIITPSKKYNAVKLAACVTALEAIVTDLLIWNGRPIPNDAHSEFMKSEEHTRNAMFYCGNFGIIVLHHLWFKDRGQAALDVLEKMIQVTMMRGAQSGGVITFQNNYDSNKKVISSYGIRSRCVNSKRTDLSKLVRKKVQNDIFPTWRFWDSNPFPSGSVTALSGHTRFATSSKASMEGTHPHQWTPPSKRSFYNMAISQDSEKNSEPQIVNVENYITVRMNFVMHTEFLSQFFF